MGHEKYLVEGFILETHDLGESDKLIKILTKDFGVVTVMATGVRELKSKLRAGLEILQLVTFEFVEGRDIKRLTGVELKEKFENIFTGENILHKRRVVSNIVNFILRTVVGETPNEKLWVNFLEGINATADSINGLHIVSPDQKLNWEIFEIIWLIKILVSLGYWEEHKLDQFSEENINLLKDEVKRKVTIEEINNTIKNTHL